MPEEPSMPLEERTVKQLQAELVKLGMPEEDSLKFTIKATILATLNTLAATKAISAVVEPKDDKIVEKHWTTKAEAMRANLLSQPKVRIRLPLEKNEKPGVVVWEYSQKTKREEQIYVSGAYHPVILNGFTWLVPKGVQVDVPQQISDELDAHFYGTQNAGKDLLLDRNDPKTGKLVSDALA